MSMSGVESVLRRAAQDEQFREHLRESPDAALHGYDITYAERQALIAGDVGELRRMGVPDDLSTVAPRFNRGDETAR